MKQISVRISLSVISIMLFFCFAGQSFAIEEQQITTIHLVNGEILIPGDPDEINWKNLSGISFQLITFSGQDPMVLAGVFISGRYKNSVLNGSAVVFTELPMVVPADFGTVVMVPENVLLTRLKSNTVGWPQLTNIFTEVELLPDGLKLKGELENGSYLPGQGITFSGRLEVAADFVYDKAPFTATLKEGGFLDVEVKDSEFTAAEFGGVDCVIEVKVPSVTPLKVEGVINDGSYDPEEGISLLGSITVMKDFTYTFGPVTATLHEGGYLDVEVEKSVFKWAEINNVQGEVDIDTGQGQLMLKGRLKGKYEDNLIDLDCNLTIREPWEYVKGPVSVTLTSGGVGAEVAENVFVRIRDGELILVNLSNSALQAALTDQSGQTQILDGTVVEGKYKDGTMTMTAALMVTEEFDIEYNERLYHIEQGLMFLILRDGIKPRVIIKSNGLKIVIDLPVGDNE